MFISVVGLSSHSFVNEGTFAYLCVRLNLIAFPKIFSTEATIYFREGLVQQ